MPVPHDYYEHDSLEPRLHNRHNGAPYIEPDWQANIAKDQLPDLSTIGRGPKGDGLYVGNVNQGEGSMSFDILSDLTGEVIQRVGPFPTGSLKVYGDPLHDPVAGENYHFYVEYSAYDTEAGKVVTHTDEISVPCGATGSLIYLYPETLDRSKDDTYQVDEDDLRIYNKGKYKNKPAVRVNDIVFLKTCKHHPATADRQAWDEYFLTFGTVEAVERGKVIFTSRVFCTLSSAYVSWDGIENKPEFHEVAFSGSYGDLSNKPVGLSDFVNDSNYQNATQVNQAIEDALSDLDLDGYLKRVDCSRSEYEGLTPDHDTVYVVSDDPTPRPTDGIAYFLSDGVNGIFIRSFEEHRNGVYGQITDIYGYVYDGVEIYTGVEDASGWKVPEPIAQSIERIRIGPSTYEISPRSMDRMFSGCRNLVDLDLSNFNTSNVTNMEDAFSWCENLGNLDLSSFNTSNVTSMRNMFYVSPALTNLDLSSFNTSNVAYMDNMFAGCSGLSEIYSETDWYDEDRQGQVSSVDMFRVCISLPNYDRSKTDWTMARLQPNGYFTLKEANNG